MGTAYGDYIDATASTAGLYIDAGAGADYINGTAFDDAVVLGEGNDQLFAGEGIDTAVFAGNAGDYRFDTSMGFLFVTRNSGYDEDALFDVEMFQFADGLFDLDQLLALPVLGTSDPDVIQGDVRGETIDAREGDDRVEAGGGNDTVYGGLGNDFLAGDEGDDTIFGGDGDDIISSGRGTNVLEGGAGNDEVYGESEFGTDIAVYSGIHSDYSIELMFSGTYLLTDSRAGRDGQDTLIHLEMLRFADGDFVIADLLDSPPPPPPPAPTNITGTNMRDSINGTDAGETIFALDGDDYVFANGGNDVIYGGAGADWMMGGDGDDIIYKDAADLFVGGDAGFDRVYLTDLTGVYISIGNGLGIEEVYGSEFNDFVDAQYTSDKVVAYGGGGDDILHAGENMDLLDGGEGDDTIIGGYGADFVSGGLGSDVFVFSLVETVTDIITDFSPAADKISFEGRGLAFADLVMSEVGPDVTIQAGTHTIYLKNHVAANLSAEHFIF